MVVVMELEKEDLVMLELLGRVYGLVLGKPCES